MRWINTDLKFVPHLATLLEVNPTAGATCVCEFDDVTPIAGVLFDGYNGASIHAHIWIAPGRKPSRLWWYAIYQYMFEACKVSNVIGTVPASNEAAQKLDEHLGFELKCVVPNYYPNGDAMMIYVCTAETAIDWRRFKPKWLNLEEAA
jgi:hypothetical protein